MFEQRGIENFIDAALASYGEPPDESALAERVLTCVSLKHTNQQTRQWKVWAIALAAVACLLLSFFVVHRPPQTTQQSARNSSAASVHSTPVDGASTARTGHTKLSAGSKALKNLAQQHSGIAEAQAAPPPKLDVFPTPHPLTLEEQALALVAVHTPPPELQALAKARDDAEPPMSIAAVHIPPLEPPDKGEN